MNVKKLFGMLIALGAVLCITLALPVNALAGEVNVIPLDGASGYKIATGSTSSCDTDWNEYEDYGNGYGIFVNIDTSAAGFTETPLYFTSLSGEAFHWTTTGATSIYNADPTGFRVYVFQTMDNSHIPGGDVLVTPEFAKSYKWHINWMAIGK